MVELHLHLDGSLSEKTVKKIMEEESIQPLGVLTEKTILSQMQYKSDNGNLADYLKCFDLPIQVLQTPEAVRYAVMKLCEDLRNDDVHYAEIRFAPQFHTKKGYSQEDILRGAIEAKDYASLLGVDIDFILCMMRGQSSRANEETLDLAVKYFNKGVVAVDLAGDEAGFPVVEYADLFRFAKKKEVPFTIHAGEAAGPESIEEALRLGAWRIGHGVAAAWDNELMNYLALHEIPLEICPTSNLSTGAVNNIFEYPLVKFIEKGMIVTINTDNRTVSDTTLKNEFELIRSVPGFEESYDRILRFNSEKSKFIYLNKTRV